MAVIQRPLKGSRISSFYPVKSLPPLSALDSAFQLQEYISLLIRLDVHDVETIVSIPERQHGLEREGSDGSNGEEKDEEKEGKDVTVDESCWVYEQLRRLAQDLTHPLITTLQQECTRSTCPEMKAGEWLYLCVAHGNESAMEQCCAIDYILHTLDSATALLNSPRAFPSRLSIPPTSTRHFSSLARRLGRIFAHAYYHHREAFEQAEAESSLYARFLALTSRFNLVPSEFLMIPPRIAAMEDDHEREDSDLHETRSSPPIEHPPPEPSAWSTFNNSSSIVNLRLNVGNSSPPADIARSASPRKVGRTRTDTMVYSEAASFAEELRNDNFSEEDLDRAIAHERMLAAGPPEIVAPLAPLERTEPEHVPLLSHEVPENEDGKTLADEADAFAEESASSQEAEVLLNIAAPEPAEPAIPTDVDDEEDITDESASAPPPLEDERAEETSEPPAESEPEATEEVAAEVEVAPVEPEQEPAVKSPPAVVNDVAAQPPTESEASQQDEPAVEEAEPLPESPDPQEETAKPEQSATESDSSEEDVSHDANSPEDVVAETVPPQEEPETTTEEEGS